MANARATVLGWVTPSHTVRVIATVPLSNKGKVVPTGKT